LGHGVAAIGCEAYGSVPGAAIGQNLILPPGIA
jgi:hypothetical protein